MYLKRLCYGMVILLDYKLENIIGNTVPFLNMEMRTNGIYFYRILTKRPFPH